MSIAADVNSIIQKRNSKAGELSKWEQQIGDIDAIIEELEEQKSRMLANSDMRQPLNKTVWESIQQLDTYAYQSKREEFRRSFGEVKNRFSRETINIAVVGEARQGKSKLLQTISGLDDKVIPAFVTTDCTGTTSMIRNVKGEPLCADITFRSEREMIESVQAYLDDMLGENVRRIESFQEIAKLDVDAIKKEIRGSAKTARLEHLEKFVKHFDEWSPCVKSRKLSTRNAEEIKTFVAQHNGKVETDPAREDYYKYLAVKKAIISCEFRFEDAGKIILQDTIGMGDTSLGIGDAMLDTIAKDSDAAVIVKRPEQGSGKFDERDLELYQTLHKQFENKNMGKWLFWLINETKGEPYGNNHDRCVAVEEKIKKNEWELAGHAIVDVSDTEKVNNGFLQMVLTTLIQNMDSIDDVLIADLNRLADELYCEYEKLQESVQQILNSEVKNAIDATTFVQKRWRTFYNQTLMGQFKKYQKEWEKKSDQECEEFREYIEEILDGARSRVPSVDVLKRDLEAGGHHGQSTVYEDHLDFLRTEFTKKFLDIDEKIFDKMLFQIKEYIVQLFAGDQGGRLKHIRAVNKITPDEWLSCAAEEIFAEEDYEEFKKAFQILNGFKLTVRGFLMNKVRRRVKVMEIETGNEKFTNTGTLEAQAEQIRRLLDRKMKGVCDALYVDLAEIYREPNEIFAALMKEFYDRLNFSSVSGDIKAEDLWQRLYINYCTDIWWEEFKDKKEMSELYREWETTETKLREYTKEKFCLAGKMI